MFGRSVTCFGFSLGIVPAAVLSIVGGLEFASTAYAQPLRPEIQPPPLPAPEAPSPVPSDPTATPPETPASDLPPLPPAPPERSAGTAGYLGLTADTVLNGRGVEVLSVAPNGPAATALFQVGDVILRGNRRALSAVEDLADVLSPLGVGEKVVFEVLRDGRVLELTVTLGNRPAAGLPAPLPAQQGMAVLGVRTMTVDVLTASRMGMPITGGALVEQVIANSPAAQAKIPRGVVVVRVDNTMIRSSADLQRAIASKRPADVVNLQIYEGTRLRSIFVRLGAEEELGNPALPKDLLRPRTETADSVLEKQQIVQELREIQREVEMLQQRAKRLEQRLNE